MKHLTHNLLIESGLFSKTYFEQSINCQFPSESRALNYYLEHYLKFDPHPLFNTNYYTKKFKGKVFKISPLEHFTRFWEIYKISPNPLFDISYYLDNNPDVASAKINPFWHYLNKGWLEGRSPHPVINGLNFLKRYPRLAKQNINPLLYWYSKDWLVDPFPEASIFLSLETKSSNSKCIAQDLSTLNIDNSSDTSAIKLIAFHLPQFHAIKENDLWWGEGFTEWSNAKKARKQFSSHNQPHLPHESIGFYDLSKEDNLIRQAELAKKSGIFGFCFYYYWFEGKRLLEKPLDIILSSEKYTFPFCICWANENWTRTWDGNEKNILIGQNHDIENDTNFILDVINLFNDPRYIRIDRKPLILIYRPGLMQNSAKTFENWRQICRDKGVGEIFIARVAMFNHEMQDNNCKFDAEIQFPMVGLGGCELNTSHIFKRPGFEGHIFNYSETAVRYLSQYSNKQLWPGVCPSWDNTARKNERGTSWINSSPESYKLWLDLAIRKTSMLKNSDKVVFVNAWNEWGEGNHLEPCVDLGFSYINSTNQIIAKHQKLVKNNLDYILIIGHDAARAGAQIVLLELIRNWIVRSKCLVKLILIRGGELKHDYEELCPTLVMDEYPESYTLNKKLNHFLKDNPSAVITNTIVSTSFLSNFIGFKIPRFAYIHELQKSIERWATPQDLYSLKEHATNIIAVSKPVVNNLAEKHSISSEKISCINPFIDIRQDHGFGVSNIRSDIRSEIGIPQDSLVVFGCGSLDWRKGPDLFIDTARHLCSKKNIYFIWIGSGFSDGFEQELYDSSKDLNVYFVGGKSDPRYYFRGGDLFFLSSREDPYPLVALEAADSSLPIVCFEKSGGIPEFVANECGVVISDFDTKSASDSIYHILTSPEISSKLSRAASSKVKLLHSASNVSEQIYDLVSKEIAKTKFLTSTLDNYRPGIFCTGPLVTCILPNYNHEAYLSERLESIACQTYCNIELLLFDDSSSDSSASMLDMFALLNNWACFIPSSSNSGSTFKQWVKAMKISRGKYIWIAESDDSADVNFLASMVDMLEKFPSCNIATCMPLMIDPNSDILGTPKEWLEETDTELWKSDFMMNGKKFIEEFMIYKNYILNASGVLIRNRPNLHELVDDSTRLCGDWLFWSRLLMDGDIAFIPSKYNLWRQASSNARSKKAGELEWKEGRYIISELCDFLDYSHNRKLELLNLFSDRCKKWGFL